MKNEMNQGIKQLVEMPKETKTRYADYFVNINKLQKQKKRRKIHGKNP